MDILAVSPFLEIQGINAASGLVYVEGSLFVISDHSSYLYHVDLNTTELHKIALVDHPQDHIEKKHKLDLECISQYGDYLYINGSGSTEKRQTQFIYGLEEHFNNQHFKQPHVDRHAIQQRDLTALYTQLKQHAGLADDQLNIEGLIINDERTLYVQRGSEGTADGIFVVSNLQDGVAISSLTIDFKAIALPAIAGVRATFTDAIQVGELIFFLAAAENTLSTYDDGEIIGSMLGIMNAQTLTLEATYLLAGVHKFEGITLYQQSQAHIDFLLCEDTDQDKDISTCLYRLSVPLKLAQINH